jgi:hypothetical protein
MTKWLNNVLSTPSSQASDMVESWNGLDSVVKSVENMRICKLRRDFLEEDILAMELSLRWKNFNEDEKISNAVCNAEYAIMRWHVDMMEMNETPTSFKEWKSKLFEKFGRNDMSEAEYARVTQGNSEKLSDYITRMEDLGIRLGIEEKRRFGFILAGISKNFLVLKTQLAFEKKVTPAIMAIIRNLEKDFYVPHGTNNQGQLKKNGAKHVGKVICFICEGSHYTTSCPEHPNKGKKLGKKLSSKEINEMEEEMQQFAVNKPNLIYVNFKSYPVVLDTGAEENYISKEMAVNLKLKLVPLETPQIRYSVDNRRIEISHKVDLNFVHDRRHSSATFLVLTETRKDKILLGRRWMKRQQERVRYECAIVTKPGQKVTEPAWAIPQKLREGTNKTIAELEAKGYIRDSNSTWSSNIRPVEKPDGSIRIATNLVALNKLVELDKYSLPNIEEILFSLHGKKWFSKLDLKDGFFQIPLKEEDRHKTAFRHEHKLKEWTVMPMGFKNAPAVFQRFMDNILREELQKSCWCYVDDILIFGSTEKEHDDNLERIKKLIKSYGLEINEKKSEYKKQEIEFLGHHLKENIIEKQLDCKEGITTYPAPKNINEVQRFLGLVNYYRKFIKNIARVCAPLFELLRKDKKFVWGNEQQQAFEQLKRALVEPTVLQQPDYDKTFILETDACNTGLGAILTQEFEGQERPIAYASRMLIGAEKNYSISEKECLGAIYGMEKFKYYLYGREFILRTDHKALERLNSGPLKSARIERWSERLQNFAFKVEYRKGESIPHVDALSRVDREVNEIKVDHEARENIKQAHEELIHRGAKATKYKLSQQGKEYSERQIREILKECLVCKAFNPRKIKGYKFVNSFDRGEKLGLDLMESPGGEYIATAIDYFTREGFAKRVPNREPKHILKFLQEIYEHMKFKVVITDGARENCDKSIRSWLEEHDITHHITSAHHPESNGRVERFNKTILDGLRKGTFKGVLQQRLRNILERYHDTYHEGLGMTPNEAKDPKSWDELKKKTYEETLDKYKKKSKDGEWDVLKKDSAVIIKTEVNKGKGDPIFEKKGQIVEVYENDSYLVQPENGRVTKRHISQLKGI